MDRTSAMGYEICDFDDDMGQSVKTNIYAIQLKRLLAEAKMWRKATIMERLVGDTNIRMKKKTLTTTASITIATIGLMKYLIYDIE